MNKEKLFPLKLPQQFHGDARRYQTPIQKYLERRSENGDYDEPSKKVSRWQRKILDSDIIRERKEFLVHPAKISLDNPDWLKSTTHYFHRSEFAPLRKETNVDKKRFDVLGNRKVDHLAYKSETMPTTLQPKRSYPQVTPKVGVDITKHTSLYKLRVSKAEDVAPKIGFSQNREIFVKQPQLKVGSLYAKNFVDTYSVN